MSWWKDKGSITRRPLSPVRAMRFIAVSTVFVTFISGVAMRIVDGREFPSVGLGLWWAAQTVTSVGYGDVVPHHTAGRILALIVMINAIAFLTVVTGAITATLLEQGGRNRLRDPQLAELGRRLELIEQALHARPQVEAAVLSVRPAPKTPSFDMKASL